MQQWKIVFLFVPSSCCHGADYICEFGPILATGYYDIMISRGAYDRMKKRSFTLVNWCRFHGYEQGTIVQQKKTKEKDG